MPGVRFSRKALTVRLCLFLARVGGGLQRRVGRLRRWRRGRGRSPSWLGDEVETDRQYSRSRGVSADALSFNFLLSFFCFLSTLGFAVAGDSSEQWRKERRLIDLHQHVGSSEPLLKRAVAIMDRAASASVSTSVAALSRRRRASSRCLSAIRHWPIACSRGGSPFT